MRKQVLLLIWRRFISMWWLRLYSSEFTQAPAIHLLVFCSCMLELTHLHSPPSHKHPKRIKSYGHLSQWKGHKSLLSGSKWKVSTCQKTSLFPNDGSHSEFDRRDKVFIPHFWPLLLFLSSLFSSNKFALYCLLFMTFPEMDFQKWSFRIFIHIMLSWN